MEETGIRAGAHLIEALRQTGLQSFALFGPGLILAFAMHYVSRALDRLGTGMLGFSFYYLTAPGVAVHELGHAAMCVVFRHRVTGIRLFSPDPAGGTLGSVSHAYNTRSLYQRIGNFFIGIGPIIIGSAVICVAAHYLVPEVFRRAAGVMETGGDAFSTMDGVSRLAGGMFHAAVGAAGEPGILSSLGRWQTLVFLYILFCVGSHIRISPPDIAHAASGFVTFIIMLFAVNAAALLFGGIPMEFFIALRGYYSVFFTAMFFALVLNAALIAPMYALKLVLRK